VTEIIRIYDAASEHFPAGTQYAIPYVDGKYAATPEQVKAIPHVRWNTVLGGQAVAAKAGVCDFEPGNESFEDPAALRAWAEGRLAMNKLARCYTNFANIALAAERLSGLGNVRWWLATLDGVQRTAAELVEMAARYHVTLDPATVWAQQYAGGLTAAYDTSILMPGATW
jgi:hypothetical protein